MSSVELAASRADSPSFAHLCRLCDATGVFDGVEDEVYIDEVHTNEDGARLLGEALWEQARTTLEGSSATEDGP